MEKISYLGFDNCFRLANDHAELIVAGDMGPRVFRYGRPGGENVFGEFPGTGVTTEYGEWKVVAGHRLWAAPESIPFSYAPDEAPVEVRLEGSLTIRITAPVDRAGLEKEMLLSMSPDNSEVEVRHRILNRTGRNLTVSVWALTAFKDGLAIVPFEPFRSHDDALLPSQPLVLWPFTDLTDSRIKLNATDFRFEANAQMEEPQKLGLANRRGWAAYHHGEDLFIKHFPYQNGAPYPDFGSNNEVYVAGSYMEIESLSPLVTLAPNEATENTERWELAGPVSREGLDAMLTELRHPVTGRLK